MRRNPAIALCSLGLWSALPALAGVAVIVDRASPVQTMPTADIERLPTQDVSQLLKVLPSVNAFARAQTACVLAGSRNPHVDGTPAADAWNRWNGGVVNRLLGEQPGSAAEILDLAAGDLGRIEVIKGGAAAEFGQDPTAGSILCLRLAPLPEGVLADLLATPLVPVEYTFEVDAPFTLKPFDIDWTPRVGAGWELTDKVRYTVTDDCRIALAGEPVGTVVGVPDGDLKGAVREAARSLGVTLGLSPAAQVLVRREPAPPVTAFLEGGAAPWVTGVDDRGPALFPLDRIDAVLAGDGLAGLEGADQVVVEIADGCFHAAFTLRPPGPVEGAPPGGPR